MGGRPGLSRGHLLGSAPRALTRGLAGPARSSRTNHATRVGRRAAAGVGLDGLREAAQGPEPYFVTSTPGTVASMATTNATTRSLTADRGVRHEPAADSDSLSSPRPTIDLPLPL